MPTRQSERHYTGRTGWLRAAVLGANDGLVSTGSLVIGVAAAHATHANVMVAAVAGLVPGSMSMAAGEYVSVSQADTERADIGRERKELAADDSYEHEELAAIYVARGLDPSLARQIAEQLMAHDAIGAHSRDELGISDTLRARPIQAALASAGTFAVGAALPLLTVVMVPTTSLIPWVAGTSLAFLALMGGLAARAGGARMVRRCATRDVLGGFGHGADRGCSSALRNRFVTRADGRRGARLDRQFQVHVLSYRGYP